MDLGLCDGRRRRRGRFARRGLRRRGVFVVPPASHAVHDPQRRKRAGAAIHDLGGVGKLALVKCQVEVRLTRALEQESRREQPEEKKQAVSRCHR